MRRVWRFVAFMGKNMTRVSMRASDLSKRIVYDASMARLDTSFRTYLRAVSPEATWLQRIAALLRRHDHAVVGAHARNAYVEPRATVDLDVLLPRDQAEVFAEDVAKLLPGGETTKRPDFIVVRRRKKKVLDIGFPANHPLFERAFADAKPRRVPAVGEVRVAPREALIAMKVLAATDPKRRPDKAKLDEGDALALLMFGRVDADYLHELAKRVSDPAQRKLAELEELARRPQPDDPGAPAPSRP